MSQFQNHLQKVPSLHISFCHSELKKKFAMTDPVQHPVEIFIYLVKCSQEKQTCHSHDDATTLSVRHQIADGQGYYFIFFQNENVSEIFRIKVESNFTFYNLNFRVSTLTQRYTYRVLQTIQMKLILLCVWAERAVLGSAKIALKFKYEIQIG